MPTSAPSRNGKNASDTICLKECVAFFYSVLFTVYFKLKLAAYDVSYLSVWMMMKSSNSAFFKMILNSHYVAAVC